MRQIGHGGGGSDTSVPECPVCYAAGGGGHGGGCPNAEMRPMDWVSFAPAGWSRPDRTGKPKTIPAAEVAQYAGLLFAHAQPQVAGWDVLRVVTDDQVLTVTLKNGSCFTLEVTASGWEG